MCEFYEIGIKKREERLRSLAIEALKAWNVSNCKLETIKIRENAVFRVKNDAGLDAAIRVHRYGYHSNAALLSELNWLRALNQDEIEVPEVIPADNGALFIMAEAIGVPEPRQVDMVKWLEGKPLGSIEEGLNQSVENVADTFREVGALAARLHNHAASWQPPAEFVRHAWNIDGLIGEKPLWGRFWDLPTLDSTQKALLLRARVAAQDDLTAIGTSSKGYGLIHADLNLDNIILRDGRVTAIDFDDCGYGWHLFDLATISILFLQTDLSNTVQTAVVEGYRRERILSDESLLQMPLFYLLRAFTYLGWVHTRNETASAQEIAPMVTALVCRLAEDYLSARHKEDEA